MKVLLTGSNGQLGTALRRSVPAGIELVPTTRAEIDLGDPEAAENAAAALAPSVIINAAAYTQVDRAEGERDRAFTINRDGAAAMARAARKVGARLIHVSTDFVFDGTRGTPYQPGDACNPLNAYGESKHAGEIAVLESLPGAATVVRTSWVYASTGANFVKTMLRLMSEKGRVDVVCDQIGSPTWAAHLADVLWNLALRSEAQGILHWTDAGVASWYDFAVAIAEDARTRGLLTDAAVVEPIQSSEYRLRYPATARRPSFSVLDKSSTAGAVGVSPRHWRTNLRSMLDELAA